MEYSRAFNSSQTLAISFFTLLEIPEVEITAIPVVRSEQSPGRSRRNIPVSLQELLYVGKAAGVRTSAKPVDRDNEIISSSEEVLVLRKDKGASSRMDYNVLQRKRKKYKGLVEKSKHFIRVSEEGVGSKPEQHPC
ncbi:hypothetical protein O181_053603 [Austropuccinia psidii MF-1]|uniref:Uncharacterized protein n=1 Tax=Austropuccinia psidii MF-1 TaxID=1389203 RepID=A0A9Q3E4N5_9BASI|nr:hypothetical protein [Austropuccinia psidii MF-1]